MGSRDINASVAYAGVGRAGFRTRVPSHGKPCYAASWGIACSTNRKNRVLRVPDLNLRNLSRTESNVSLEPVEIGEVGYVTPHCSDVAADQQCRLVQSRLPARCDVDERAFFDERLAVARPIPLLPPVTRATFPWSFGIEILLTRWERPLGPVGRAARRPV